MHIKSSVLISIEKMRCDSSSIYFWQKWQYYFVQYVLKFSISITNDFICFHNCARKDLIFRIENPWIILEAYLGPVVQSIVSSTNSLKGKLLKGFTTYNQMLLKKIRKAFAMQCKSFSHFVNKTIGVFEILTFEILSKSKLTTSLVLNNLARLFKASLA